MFRIHLYLPEHRDRDFYADIAPFFMSRAIRKEMPYLDDRPDKTWYMAREMETHEVLAIAATYPDKGDIYLSSLYVLPHHRRQGLARSLVRSRLEDARGRIVRTVVNPRSAPFYLSLGFTEFGRRGSYLHLMGLAPVDFR